MRIGQRNLVQWTAFEEGTRGIFGRQYFANNGPLVQELDRAIAAYCRVPYAASVSNGMMAMMLLARVVFKPGEIIVPAYLSFEMAEALRWGGYGPIGCDVNPSTLLIDVDSFRKALTPRITGIVGVHLFGRLGDPSPLEEAAAAAGIPLIFDARDALGCEAHGRRAGGFGLGAVLSFHQDALLNAGDGGSVATRDETVWNGLRAIRNFYSGQMPVPELRMNGKMSEAPAMLALAGLQEIDAWIAANSQRHAAYLEALADVDGVELFCDGNERSAFARVVVSVSPATAGLSAGDLITALNVEGIEARRALKPGLNEDPSHSPVVARLFDEFLELPNTFSMSLDDVRRVASVIAERVKRR